MKYVVLHGLGQRKSSWDFIRGKLEMIDDKDILIPELSDFLSNDNYSYDNLYRNFCSYLESIDDEINICGLSLGAILALNYAIDYPGKVNSIVIIAGQYKIPKLIFKIQNYIFKILPKKTFEGMGMEKESIIQLTKSMIDLDLSEGLKNISARTLIICGDKDTANRKAAKELSEIIANAEFEIIKDAKHEVNIDSQVELGDIILKFYLEER